MFIAYVHGFLSGPNAVKSTILKNYISKNEKDITFLAPDFPDTPKEAYEALVEYFKPYKGEKLMLVGSSMGGFFSTHLSYMYKFKACLLNPCVHPQDYFNKLIGSQYNECTGRHFELKDDMIDLLRDLDENCKFDKDLIHVYLQDGDEVLDYKKALAFYQECQIEVDKGGCHAFENFEGKIPKIIDFLKA